MVPFNGAGMPDGLTSDRESIDETPAVTVESSADLRGELTSDQHVGQPDATAARAAMSPSRMRPNDHPHPTVTRFSRQVKCPKRLDL